MLIVKKYRPTDIPRFLVSSKISHSSYSDAVSVVRFAQLSSVLSSLAKRYCACVTLYFEDCGWQLCQAGLPLGRFPELDSEFSDYQQVPGRAQDFCVSQLQTPTGSEMRMLHLLVGYRARIAVSA